MEIKSLQGELYALQRENEALKAELSGQVGQIITCDTNITLYAPPYAVDGEIFTVSGVLTSPSGWLCSQFVNDAEVQLYVSGSLNQKTKTDANGRYSFVVVLPLGRYQLQTKFPGSLRYNPSSSLPVTIDVKAKGTPPPPLPECTADIDCVIYGKDLRCVNGKCVKAEEKMEIPWLWIGGFVFMAGIIAIALYKPEKVGAAAAEAERKAREAAERARAAYGAKK